MRKAISLCVAILLLSTSLWSRPADAPSIKQRVLDISLGVPVEIRLADKSRIRGRLGAATDSGFELQTVKSGKIETVQIPFDTVKSIKETNRKSVGSSVGTGVAIGVAVVAALLIIGVIAYVVGGD